MGARAGGRHRPPAERSAGSPSTGRPQLAATLRGRGGGRSLLLNGHIDVVPAKREEGWTADPFDAQVVDGNIVGRGACDMKGGIAAMVVAAEALAATGELRGDIVVCTNTDEESSGVGGLACARHGVRADFAIVPEPSSLEVWPACRGTVYCTITLTGRAGHAEQEHPHWRDGGAVNAIEKGRFLLDGVDRLRADWRSRADLRHPLLDPPDIVPTRFVADAGWSVTIPNRVEIDLSVLILPSRPTREAGQPTLRLRSRASCAAGARPTRGWSSTRRASTGTPRSTRPRRRWTRTACWRCVPPTRARDARQARRAGHLVRRGDVRAGGEHARADVRAARDRLGAHRRRVRADRRPRQVRAGHRDRGVAAVSVKAAVLRAPGAAVEITR